MRCFFVVLIASSFLAACSKTGTNGAPVSPYLASEQSIFQIMGQGLLGSAFMALSSQNQRAAIEAEYRALEYAPAGQKISWQAYQTASQHAPSGAVTAGQPYRVGGQNCRQYRHEFIIDGVPQTSRGSACRNEDGSWSPLT